MKKVIEYLANECGEECGEECRELVLNGSELKLVEPPIEKAGTEPTQLEIEKYKMKCEMHLDKEDAYKVNKGKTFIGIREHCALSLINKLESLSEHSVKENDDDVIWLLEKIKGITLNKTEVTHNCMTALCALKTCATTHQQENESLNQCYKRFGNNIKELESTWGQVCPEVTVKNEITSAKVADVDGNGVDEQKLKAKGRDKFVACMFLLGANREVHGKCVHGLNNDYLAGNEHCPKTTEKALECLQNYKDTSHVKKEVKKDDSSSGSNSGSGAGFVQLEDRECYYCGEKGHMKHQCPQRSNVGC